ncbi:hypothetical protein DLM45_02490 [Hyphomicrobium methylovorum]|nr:hypothetical protein [Hyphomicrobium methylovorum]
MWGVIADAADASRGRNADARYSAMHDAATKANLWLTSRNTIGALMNTCAKHQDEITSLRAQLADAKAKAIEECAKTAEAFGENHGVQWGNRKRFELRDLQRAMRGACNLIAEDIRALASLKEGE